MSDRPVDRIEVLGVRALGRHGADDGEREHPQPFDVDVVVGHDVSAAAALDRLGDTVDYTLIVAEIRRVVAEESFQLIESLAQAIAERVLALGALEARVRVSKPGAAASLGASQIAVEVSRRGPV